MSLENTSSDETLMQHRTTQPKNKVKRSRKVIWTPTSEKETYRTVVVNYHYNNMDKNNSSSSSGNNNHRNTGTIPKKRDNTTSTTFSQMMTAMSTAMNNARKNSSNGGSSHPNSSEDFEDVPSLRKLYEESRDELCQQCGNMKSSSSSSSSKENSQHSNVFRDSPEHKLEDIKMEIYSVPTSQHAVVEEFEMKSIKKSEDDVEVIVISDDDEDEDDDDADAENEEGDAPTTRTTTMTTSPPSNKHMLLNHAQHHNPYQTMRIVSSTKSTQNPERKSSDSQQQITSAVGKLKSQDGIEHIKIRTLLPEVASNTSNSQKQLTRNAGRTPPQNTFKQRQLELHRHRIAVEEKRLELLEVKLKRECDEMVHESILFEKELQLKESQLRQLREDRDML